MKGRNKKMSGDEKASYNYLLDKKVEAQQRYLFCKKDIYEKESQLKEMKTESIRLLRELEDWKREIVSFEKNKILSDELKEKMRSKKDLVFIDESLGIKDNWAGKRRPTGC